MERKYGWKRQKRDDRDLQYSTAKPIAGLPRKSDLTGQLPDCWDQEETSDCISHGCGAAFWNGEVVADQVPVMPSRLFNYWNFRDIEGDTNKDEGGQIRDGIKAANLYGIAPESVWPWTPDETLFTRPSQEAYDAAEKNKIHFYASINLRNLDQVRLALSHKLGIVFGFDVPNFFESATMEKNGIMRLSDYNRIVGGHCTFLLGHDDDEELGLVRNSWGTSWGPFKGNFKIGYDVLTSDYCSDAWVVRMK